jgi:hypothetical protein
MIPPPTEEELKEAREFLARFPNLSEEAKVLMPHVFTIEGLIKLRRSPEYNLPNPYLAMIPKKETK